MKNLWLKIITLITLSSASYGQVWHTLLTADSNGYNEGVSTTKTDGNSLLFAGNFRTDFSLAGIDLVGNSNYRGFWGKGMVNGQIPWLKTMHSSRDLMISKISAYKEYVAVSGYYSDTLFIENDTMYNDHMMGIFVAIYDTSGNYMYTINPDVESANISDIKFDNDGFLVVTGDYYKTFNFDNYSFSSPLAFHLFLFKYDVIQNELMWLFAVTEGTNTLGSGLDIDSENNIYIIGSYGDDVLFDDVSLINNNSNHNLFTAKFNQNGNLYWAESIIGLSQVHGTKIAVDKHGDVYFTGDFQSSVDSVGSGVLTASGFSNALVGKYNTDGELIWMQSIGGSDQDKGVQVELDSLGAPVFLISSGAGAYIGDISVEPFGFTEPLIIKLHPNDGTYIWHQRITAQENIGTVNGLDMTILENQICITGRNRNEMYFQNQSYTAPNNRDFFIAVITDTLYVVIEEVDDDNLSLGEHIGHSPIVIYPNPSSNSFTFKNFDGNHITEIILFDTSGKIVYKDSPNVSEFMLSENLSTGMYYCEIKVLNTIQTHKIVKL